MNTFKPLVVVVVIVLAVVAGVLTQHYVDGASQAPSVLGQKRIDFTMADIDGRPRHLSEWDGKIILVNFWATWCPPCQEEIPGFVQLQSEYGKQGLQIVGVAVDESRHHGVVREVDDRGPRRDRRDRGVQSIS